MNCPKCNNPLRGVEYEGIRIESCDACRGEWLDADELGKIVKIREQRFDAEEQRAIAAAKAIRGVWMEDVQHDLTCPKCAGPTKVIHYGGDTGILLDRCEGCRGFWLDDGELEKVQQLVEGWEDNLPDDLKEYGSKLRQVAVETDAADDARISRLPGGVGRFLNAAINGILDLLNV